MGKVAGGDDVRDRCAKGAAGARALGQMHFKEGAVPAGKAAEWTERLDDACAVSPSAASPSSKRDDRDRTRGEGFFTYPSELVFHAPSSVKDVFRGHVLNERGGWEPILREPDAAGAQGRLNSLVLHRVEAVF